MSALDKPDQALTLGPASATADQIIDFAQRYDPQPFHLSDEGARHTIFGSLAASGWHTAALAMQLLLTDPRVPFVHDGLLSIRDLRWRRPVYPDDALYLQATTVESAPADASVAVFDLTLHNQEQVRVFSCQVTVKVLKKRDD